jgi:hypothetical protein
VAKCSAEFSSNEKVQTMALTRHSFGKITLGFGLVMASVACSGYGGQQDADSDTGPVKVEQDQAEVTAMKKLSIKEQAILAQKDLVARLEVDSAAVTFSGATSVNWRSGALGCPEPGMSYTQALVPGTWIMLKSGKTVYRYHAARSGQPFYCPDDRAEPPLQGAGAD